MAEKLMAQHVFVFNPEDNGGESLLLTTKIYDNGDEVAGIGPGLYTNQELTLHSYCNSASFTLCGAGLHPKNLRELANQLEFQINRVKAQLEAEHDQRRTEEVSD